MTWFNNNIKEFLEQQQLQNASSMKALTLNSAQGMIKWWKSMKIRCIERASPVSSSFKSRIELFPNSSNSILWATIISHLNHSNCPLTGLPLAIFYSCQLKAIFQIATRVIFQEAKTLKTFPGLLLPFRISKIHRSASQLHFSHLAPVLVLQTRQPHSGLSSYFYFCFYLV